MITLYQFTISHFCEKARWALSYKKLDFRAVNLLPGQHVSVIRKIAPRSSVPVIVDGKKVVQDSLAIISYLDEQYPEHSLTPVNPAEKTAAIEWERYLNKELGVHVRRFCYHSVLQDKALTVRLLGEGGPWYGKLLLRLVYGKLVKRMRQYMDINEATAAESRQHILAAVDRLHHTLRERRFLVGESFSRADLTAAALLAPLCMPAKYPVPFGDKIPAPLAALKQEIAGRTAWVGDWYNRYR